MTTPTTPVSGEIWFKAQRVLRTIVQAIVGIAGALAVFVLVAPQVLDAVADVLPASWVAAAAAFIAGAAAISAALSRVMAIPKVDAWLKRLGLGSAPRSAPPITTSHVVIGQDGHAYLADPSADAIDPNE